MQDRHDSSEKLMSVEAVKDTQTSREKYLHAFLMTYNFANRFKIFILRIGGVKTDFPYFFLISELFLRNGITEEKVRKCGNFRREAIRLFVVSNP